MNDQDTSRTRIRWDAGHAGCGKLIAELRSRIGQLQPGNLFEVTARDTGAQIDLPAWCRMTDHCLMLSDHPVYVIQVRPALIES